MKNAYFVSIAPCKVKGHRIVPLNAKLDHCRVQLYDNVTCVYKVYIIYSRVACTTGHFDIPFTWLRSKTEKK